jgi:hypothetical protein
VILHGFFVADFGEKSWNGAKFVCKKSWNGVIMQRKMYQTLLKWKQEDVLY